MSNNVKFPIWDNIFRIESLVQLSTGVVRQHIDRFQSLKTLAIEWKEKGSIPYYPSHYFCVLAHIRLSGQRDKKVRYNTGMYCLQITNPRLA